MRQSQSVCFSPCPLLSFQLLYLSVFDILNLIEGSQYSLSGFDYAFIWGCNWIRLYECKSGTTSLESLGKSGWYLNKILCIKITDSVWCCLLLQHESLRVLIVMLNTDTYDCINTCCIPPVLRVFALSATASILQAWLNQCSEDFREPPNYPCLLKVLDYLKKNVSGSEPERRAQNLLEQFQNQEVENDGKLPFPSLRL